jgi:N-acyl-D-aspartate/D-glutamate deacylase
VIFDPETVNDNATYNAPHQFSAGIPYVMVNGVPVIEEGRHNGSRKGKVLKRN